MMSHAQSRLQLTRHVFFEFLIVLALCSNCFAQPDAKTESLPGFDYWRLTAEILKDHLVPEALEMDPAQVRKVDALYSGEYMKEVFKSKRAEISVRWRRGEREKGPFAFPLEQTILECDEVVRVELSKILNKKQLAMLRPVVMRRRFKFGFSPFYDATVADFCKVSRADRQKLGDLVEDMTVRFQRELANVRAEFGAIVAKSLPDESQKLFACYIGNAYLPRYKLPPDFDFKSVPHHKDEVLALQAFLDICQSAKLRTELVLTPEQSKRLLEAHDKREKALAASREDRRTSYASIWMTSADECTELLRDTLNPLQALTMCQAGYLQKFHEALEEPFTRRNVVQYLQLDKEQTRAVRVLAAEKQIELKKKESELNRAAFDSLCNTLPEAEREAYRKLFVDVY